MNNIIPFPHRNTRSITGSDSRLAEIVELVFAMAMEDPSANEGFDIFESLVLRICNEVGRLALQKRLQDIAKEYQSEYLLVNEERYRRHQEGTVRYHSLCGTVSVSRFSYRQADVSNGSTVVPLELISHLQERATPALAYRIVLGDAQCPGRQWEDLLLASYRAPPARSTLERIAKNLGSKVRSESFRILSVVRQEESLPEEPNSLSIGLDRTTIPMEEKLRYGSTSPPIKRRKTPYMRKVPHPVEVNCRMGHVGTVSISGADGRNLQTYRYGCSSDQDPTEITREIMADVAHIIEHRKKADLPELPLGIVQDGAPEMWSLMESAIAEALPGQSIERAIDRYHLAERLAESLKALKSPYLNRDVRMRQWSQLLDESDTAIDEIEAFILRERNRLEKLRSLSADNREILRTHLKYIENNKHLMRYASLRKKGLPMGSGATEGACKSLIMIRTKGCGQRWHSYEANAVLALRGLYQSNRLPSFWSNMLKQQEVSIRAVA